MKNRRQVLLGSASVALSGMVQGLVPGNFAMAADATVLNVDTRILDVKGKPARVYGLTQQNGVAGVETVAGSAFRVSLNNRLDHDTLVHWHGLTPPADQDGVPGLSQSPLKSGESHDYDFPLERPGTYWMHSHVGFQEQLLLAAPLIVHDPSESGIDEQNVVMLLHDFTFRSPDEILHQLMSETARMDHNMDMGMNKDPGMNMDMGMGHSMDAGQSMDMGSGMDMGQNMDMSSNMKMDINDIEFDAYLANDRTLEDPEVTRVEPGGMIRLRIINAAASTNFMIDLGGLSGSLISVDGQPVIPVSGSRFEIAIAQRLDIRLKLPRGQGSYPVFAQREGDRIRTGIVLATRTAMLTKFPRHGEETAGPVRLDLERRLTAVNPLAVKQADQNLNLDLTGSMMPYRWSLNGRVYEEREPLMVSKGERVEITMRNKTGMAHPMHLHGHVFQVVALNGSPVNGALRDTVMVPPGSSVAIAFDADNPGRWAFHCHNLYHMAAGMFTTLEYAS